MILTVWFYSMYPLITIYDRKHRQEQTECNDLIIGFRIWSDRRKPAKLDLPTIFKLCAIHKKKVMIFELN